MDDSNDEIGTIVTSQDLSEIIIQIIEKHKMFPMGIIRRMGRIVKFIHPITNQNIVFSENYEQRERICKRAYELFPDDVFIFNNQSLATIVQNLFEFKIGKISDPNRFNATVMSASSDFDREITNIYHLNAMVDTLIDTNKVGKSYDIKKCRTNVLEHMPEDYIMFTVFDNWLNYDGHDIVPGEYILDSFIIPQLGNFRHKRSIHNYILVKYLLEKDYIDKSIIKLARKASILVPRDGFRDFKRFICKEFPNDYKSLLNIFIGCLGKRFNRIDKGMITSDFNDILAAITHYGDDVNNQIDYDQLNNDLYVLNIQFNTPLNLDKASIYRQILSVEKIDLLKLIENWYIRGYSKLVGYNTDSIYIINPANRDISNIYREQPWGPIKYKIWIDRPFIESIKSDDWKIIGENEANMDMSFMVEAGPGDGKTFLAMKIRDKDTVGLSFMNRTVNNFRKDEDDMVYTLDGMGYKQIKKCQIDEVQIAPAHGLQKVYLKRPKVIQMFGDMNQTRNIGLKIDLLNNRTIKEMCNYTKVKLEPKNGRFSDPQTKIYLKQIKKTGLIPNLNQPINPSLTTNVTFTNDLRDKINSLFFKKWEIGMRIITNKKTDKLDRSEKYYIQEINENEISVSKHLDGPIVGDIPYKNGDGERMFEPVYAITNHKYLGDRIDEPFNMYELDRMNLNDIISLFGRSDWFNWRYTYTEKKFKPDNSGSLITLGYKPKSVTNIDIIMYDRFITDNSGVLRIQLANPKYDKKRKYKDDNKDIVKMKMFKSFKKFLDREGYNVMLDGSIKKKMNYI